MGADKRFTELAGKPVLLHAVEAFAACTAIDEIIVVTSPDAVGRIEAWQSACPKLSKIVEGGAERHLSVYRGLEALSPETDLVAVHDGARPLVTPSLITRCTEAAAAHGAAACARPLTDTVKRANADGTAGESVDRAGLWAMETPQVARASLLRSAYEAVLAENLLVTDEVSALQHMGESVMLVENPDPNIKITFPADLALAEAILNARSSVQ